MGYFSIKRSGKRRGIDTGDSEGRTSKVGGKTEEFGVLEAK